MTPEQLQAIITSAVTVAVQEARKPAPLTEDELARKKQDEDMRRMQAEQELAMQAGRRAAQKRCPHRHPNGTASIGEVNSTPQFPNTAYIICVHCQAKIKPAKSQYDEIPEDFIYDENLYWSLLGSRQTTTF